MNLTITPVGSGKYSDCFRVTAGNKSVIMKLSYYRDATIDAIANRLRRNDIPGARAARALDSIKVSSEFGKLTNQLVKSGVSPHFVFVYYDTDCTDLAARLKSLLADRLKTATPAQMRWNNVAFMEPFSTNMTKWLRGFKSVNNESIRGTVFQVLYTLAALQKNFPGFRHNDLSTNNVLVKKLRRGMTGTYATPHGTYAIKGLPVFAALSDYDFTHVPTVPSLHNERVMGGRYRVSARENNSYDTHFFLKSVGKCTRNAPFHAFLKTLPLHKEDRTEGIHIPALDPANLLRHPYFAPLLESPYSGTAGYTFYPG